MNVHRSSLCIFSEWATVQVLDLSEENCLQTIFSCDYSLYMKPFFLNMCNQNWWMFALNDCRPFITGNHCMHDWCILEGRDQILTLNGLLLHKTNTSK
ncbi:hypothetical protein L6164_019748 [Bauhinia variegata]|uniref:Uncharacterized protein n=1 Tax=Bauhinia variegata TaxID=167791 RepID=A0ACB9MSW0_BAUVA|nr:hypothetical protein L6164_019748 [Bauhinia variegata]